MTIRKPIFDAIKSARGKGFAATEVIATDQFLDRMGVPPEGAPAAPKPLPKKTLAAVLGSVGAATALFVSIPADESGRKVDAQVQPDGSIALRHVSGQQHLKAYLDIVKVPTACDGITRGIQIGQTFTAAQCDALLERELVIHAEGVMACTPSLSGRPNQQIAAVSLAYNVGVGAYCKSSIDRQFDAKNWRAGCDALLLWNKAGGRAVRGLTLRREREREICLEGL